MKSEDHLSFEALHWFESTSSPPKAVIICVHGLNNPPSMFDSLCAHFATRGYSVLRVGLSGHTGAFREFQNVLKANWLEEVKEAYLQARSKCPDLPIFAVGYSLGGALCTLLQNDDDDVQFRRMFLIAPAIALRTWSRTLMKLSGFLPKNLGMPSATPKKFQRFARTPVMAYRQLYLVQKSCRESVPSRKLLNTPTRVYVSSHDEFMSIMDIQVWINERSISNWEITRLDPLSRTTRGHLIASPDTIGDQAWDKMLASIERLFS